MGTFSSVLLGIVVIFCLLTLISCAWAAHRYDQKYAKLHAEGDRTFDERFPPISDAEFMARCRPGTRPEIALKIRQIMSDCSGIDYKQIYPESQLVRDLDMEKG